jgi:hypothetical protein
MTRNNKKNITENIYVYEPEEKNILNDNELERNSKGGIFENIHIYVNNSSIIIFKTSIILFKASGIYLLWIMMHYFSAHLYIKFCVPNTFIGFIMSPFMIATPHCQGLRWIVYNSAGVINNMWILIGTWIYSLIWIFNTNNMETTRQ